MLFRKRSYHNIVPEFQNTLPKEKQTKQSARSKRKECEAFTVDKRRKRKKCDDESIFFHLYAANVAM